MNITSLAAKTGVLFTDLLREIVLDKPALRVDAYPQSGSVSLSIQSNPTDQGRIIGGRGLHFRSLLALANCIGLKNGCTVNLAPMPRPTKRSERYDAFQPKEDWRKKEVGALLGRVVTAVAAHDQSVEINLADQAGAVTLTTVRMARSESYALILSMIQGMVNPSDGSAMGWLKILFNAVGKANGRTIFLEVIADQDFEPQQPATADGRHSRELSA
jgi:predicted RNA-binding protein YlqC (UPF0109 family)